MIELKNKCDYILIPRIFSLEKHNQVCTNFNALYDLANNLFDIKILNYNVDISSNYNDCGTMLYDLDNQPVLAGASGPVCSGLVIFGYIYKEMLKGKYKKVLIVPTGAIFSPTLTFQKETIPSIANAISLEVVE